jgi:hypothetical protein
MFLTPSNVVCIKEWFKSFISSTSFGKICTASRSHSCPFPPHQGCRNPHDHHTTHHCVAGTVSIDLYELEDNIFPNIHIYISCPCGRHHACTVW